MGTNTEFKTTTIHLKRDTPQEIIDILKDFDDERLIEIDHPFFKTERWYMIRIKYYDYNFRAFGYLKNYDEEIQKFFNWILPYCLLVPDMYFGKISSQENCWMEYIDDKIRETSEGFDTILIRDGRPFLKLQQYYYE